MSKGFSPDGKTVAITGAASGIGAALARDLGARGCRLELADINRAGLDQLAAELADDGVDVHTSVLDIADRDAIYAWADAVAARRGSLDMLFNNAGVAIGGTFEQIAEADFDWLLSINLFGVIRTTRAFLPMLHKAERAHIVNISSLFGLIAPVGQTAYCASKYGVRGFSDCLRHELLDTSIGVTTVHPGGVATNIATSARRPAGVSNAEVEAHMDRAERLLVMPPPQAARIILTGVEKGKPRILIGRDAKIAALIERLRPGTYWKVFAKRMEADEKA